MNFLTMAVWFSGFSFVLIVLNYFITAKVCKKIIIQLMSNANLMSLKDFPEMQIILEWHMERAYRIIYKDEILVYSAGGMSIREEDYTSVQKHFLNLTIDLMGSNLINQYVWFYGSDTVLYRNMCLYFDDSYESDTLRNNTIKAQMEDPPIS